MKRRFAITPVVKLLKLTIFISLLAPFCAAHYKAVLKRLKSKSPVHGTTFRTLEQPEKYHDVHAESGAYSACLSGWRCRGSR